MSTALFIVEWDPTTDTAHVRATFDTVTAEETVAGLDQFAACVRKLREINDLTGVSGRIRVEAPEGVTVATVASTGPFPDDRSADECLYCDHRRDAHDGPETPKGYRPCSTFGCSCQGFTDP